MIINSYHDSEIDRYYSRNKHQGKTYFINKLRTDNNITTAYCIEIE